MGDTSWLIEREDTGDYFLSGVFTVSPPKDHGRPEAWHGTRNLPKTKINIGKP
jgi:hypothetical protein